MIVIKPINTWIGYVKLVRLGVSGVGYRFRESLQNVCEWESLYCSPVCKLHTLPSCLPEWVIWVGDGGWLGGRGSCHCCAHCSGYYAVTTCLVLCATWESFSEFQGVLQPWPDITRRSSTVRYVTGTPGYAWGCSRKSPADSRTLAASEKLLLLLVVSLLLYSEVVGDMIGCLLPEMVKSIEMKYLV